MTRIMAMAFGLLAIVAGAAVAQTAAEDPMEVQRCVWSCLANSSGASDPAYSACVEAICNAPQEDGLENSAGNPGAWTTGVTADGLGLYAAMVDPVTANTLYFLCDRSGAGYLMLTGQAEGPSATLTVQIGANPYPLWFEEQGGGYYANTPRDSTVIALMARGGMVQVLNATGYVMGTYPTPMQGNAVADVDLRCRQ
jgi:hypothetical protein